MQLHDYEFDFVEQKDGDSFFSNALFCMSSEPSADY